MSHRERLEWKEGGKRGGEGGVGGGGGRGKESGEGKRERGEWEGVACTSVGEKETRWKVGRKRAGLQRRE